MKMFVYNSSLVSFEVCIHIQYFSMQWEINFIQSISTRVNYIKRRSKVPEKNTSCGRALNFEQWKTFSQNCKRIGFDYGLFTNLPRILSLATSLRVHSNSKEESYLSWQNTILTWKLVVISSQNFSCELNS